MATRRPNQKLSLHRIPLRRVHCRQLLDMIGVPRDYQDQFIIPTKGGYTVRVQAAGRWVKFFLDQWQRYLKDLERQFEANGNWPPPSIKVGFERLILSGLTNDEAHAILDPIFDIGGRRRPNQACYYRFHLARAGKLPPELCPEYHPYKTGCKGGKREM